MVTIINVLGQRTPTPMHGYAEFRIDGRQYRLEGTDTPETGKVFFNFRDASCNTVAYQPGRFLDAPFSPTGRIRLDFNRAYNPPCAYTSHATCPLPHKENVLKVAIPAGEIMTVEEGGGGCSAEAGCEREEEGEREQESGGEGETESGGEGETEGGHGGGDRSFFGR